MADEELLIEIDGEGEKTGGDPVEDLKSQLATLEAREKAERNRREAAERIAADAQQRAHRAVEEVKTVRTDLADSQLGTIESGIAAAQAEAAQAETDYAAAAEAGDFKKQAEAQRRIARAEAKLTRLDEAKNEIEVRRADAGKQTERRAEAAQQRQPSDPVEAFVSSRSPQTQEWLRAHPEQAAAMARQMNGSASGDEVKRARKLSAAHEDALAEGYAADTPQYFEHVEKFIGLKKEPTNGAAKPQPQRRSSPAVAPVSQSGAGNGTTGGTQVRLTQGEAAAATDGTHVWNAGNLHPETGKPIKRDDPIVGTPIGHREFAKRKLAMQRQGAYDKIYVEQ